MGVLLFMTLFLAASENSNAGGSAGEQPRTVGVVAHRGAGGGTRHPERPPENTLPALSWGWQRGSPWVECDVILTADRIPILSHDFIWDRVSGKSIEIDKTSLEDVQKLDAGAWKSSRWADVSMPSLAEALAIVPEDKGLIIEIKSGPEAAIPVIQTIEASEVGFDRLMIISFNVDTLRACRKHCREVPILWLMSFEQKETADSQEENWWVSWRSGPGRGQRQQHRVNLEALVAGAVEQDFDGLDTTPHHPAELPRRLSAEGLILGVWTVNDPERAVALVRSGVEEVTTDEPGMVIKALEEAGIGIGRCHRRRPRSRTSTD